MFLILLSTAFHASCFPIFPVPLRHLILESEVIVWARVEPGGAAAATSLKSTIPYISIRGSSPAPLRVYKVLKGPATNGELIEVHYQPDLTCPTPPSFPPGSNVLAFLRAREARGYETIGLHYGAKLLSEEEATSYFMRISEFCQIASNHNPAVPATRDPFGVPVPNKAMLEWLVRCVEDPVTRWEGGVELIPTSGLISGTGTATGLASRLDANQFLRLSNTLFRIQYLSYRDLPLLELFRQHSPRRTIPFLIDYLRAAQQIIPPLNSSTGRDALPHPVVISWAMSLLAESLDNAEARILLEQWSDLDFTYKAEKRIRQITEFLPIIEKDAKRRGYHWRGFTDPER